MELVSEGPSWRLIANPIECTVLLVEDPGLCTKGSQVRKKASTQPSSSLSPRLLTPVPALTSQSDSVTWICKPVSPSHSYPAFTQSFITVTEKQLGQNCFVSDGSFNIFQAHSSSSSALFILLLILFTNACPLL